ncbi:putative G-protein coupled receptor 148 [Rhinoraja longicauda]
MDASANCSVPGWDAGQQLLTVRLLSSLASFTLLLFFSCVIGVAVLSAARLRSQTRFVLLLQLHLSALLYFGLSSCFYLVQVSGAEVQGAGCLALLLSLMVSGSCILLTLTLMALDRYLAVCHPLRYSALSAARRARYLCPLLWLLSSILPLVLVTHQSPSTLSSPPCSLRSGHQLGQTCKFALIGACTLLILFSYTKIFALTRRSRRARSTILMHGAQLAVYIVPAFITFLLQRLAQAHRLQHCTKARFEAANYAFFSLAQCISPVIYGLRKDELRDLLSHTFPCYPRHYKPALRWTVRRRLPQPTLSPARELPLRTLHRGEGVDTETERPCLSSSPLQILQCGEGVDTERPCLSSSPLQTLQCGEGVDTEIERPCLSSSPLQILQCGEGVDTEKETEMTERPCLSSSPLQTLHRGEGVDTERPCLSSSPLQILQCGEGVDTEMIERPCLSSSPLQTLQCGEGVDTERDRETSAPNVGLINLSSV